MKLTYYGHACFTVKAAGKTILFDPFITENALAKDKVDIDSISADAILVTHAHFDHISDVVPIAKRTGATVLAPYETLSGLVKMGVDEGKGVPMGQGGARTFPFGRVKLTSAIHSSSFPDGSYGGSPCGFIIETDEGRYYNAGDTALTHDMKLVADSGEPIKFAAVPIGDHFTMGAADAAIATKFAGGTIAVGLHYNTFPPIEIDPNAAHKTFDEAGLTLHLPAIGESIEL